MVVAAWLRASALPKARAEIAFRFPWPFQARLRSCPCLGPAAPEEVSLARFSPCLWAHPFATFLLHRPCRHPHLALLTDREGMALTLWASCRSYSCGLFLPSPGIGRNTSCHCLWPVSSTLWCSTFLLAVGRGFFSICFGPWELPSSWGDPAHSVSCRLSSNRSGHPLLLNGTPLLRILSPRGAFVFPAGRAFPFVSWGPSSGLGMFPSPPFACLL